jgi:hypothetical protein
MGRASREKVEREFDERIVIDTYLTLLRRLEGRQSTTQHLRA